MRKIFQLLLITTLGYSVLSCNDEAIIEDPDFNIEFITPEAEFIRFQPIQMEYTGNLHALSYYTGLEDSNYQDFLDAVENEEPIEDFGVPVNIDPAGAPTSITLVYRAAGTYELTFVGTTIARAEGELERVAQTFNITINDIN